LTRFLLDTNIISEAIKPRPSPAIIDWMAGQRRSDLFLSAMTIGEMRRGILQMPDGKRKQAMSSWFEGTISYFEGRVLPFSGQAALHWADLMATSRSKGHNRDAVDTIIAATALAHDCVVVTANTRDFDGVETLNPS
jgi:predicted nucleic acid-binding protein